MKVFLLKNIKNIGQQGNIIEVADGYAHNNLFPKKLAVPATQKVIQEFESQKKT